MLLFADFDVKTGLKIVTHRDFHYWASFNEPAILGLLVLRKNILSEKLFLAVVYVLLNKIGWTKEVASTGFTT